MLEATLTARIRTWGRSSDATGSSAAEEAAAGATALVGAWRLRTRHTSSGIGASADLVVLRAMAAHVDPPAFVDRTRRLRRGGRVRGADLRHDRHAARGLECVFLGPELEFTASATVAVAGAELTPKVDGAPRATWTSFPVAAGQRLSFDFLRSGARAYLAVSGGIDVPVVLGSRSTYPLGALGGYQGRALKAGDELAVYSAPRAAEGRTVPPDLRPAAGKPAVLRVLPGLYWHRIAEQAGRDFFADTWKVAPEADRIGYRFRGGRPLQFVPREQPFDAGSDPSNIVDACYPYGSIQVPGGTEPIVLHRDAVSGGGYFMIGTVISADMDLIGQLQPHTEVRFVEVDMAGALSARHDHEARLARVRAAISG